MEIKNVYEPDNEDLLNWIKSSGDSYSWPDADWDLYVSAGGDNDHIIFKYANMEGEKQLFFIHCLYYLAGEYFVGKSRAKDTFDYHLQIKKTRLDTLLSHINNHNHALVKEWASYVESVLDEKIVYKHIDWFGYLFWGDR